MTERTNLMTNCAFSHWRTYIRKRVPGRGRGVKEEMIEAAKGREKNLRTDTKL